jgi:hypothetical protein
MIQRVQSIWLFLASLTLFLLLILPILTKQVTGGEVWLQVGGIYQHTANAVQQLQRYTGLFGLTIFTGVVCLYNIFNFKNRTLQKRIILLAILLILILSGCLAGYAWEISDGMKNGSLAIGAALPLLTLIFCTLAFRGIRKDEQLIRSADRLR